VLHSISLFTGFRKLLLAQKMIIFLSIYSDGLVTNSHIFAAIQYGLNTSDYTYNTLDANAAPSQ